MLLIHPPFLQFYGGFFVPCFKTHKFANWNGQETNGRTIFFSMGDINIWFPPFLTLYAPIRKPTTSCRIARCFWMKNRFMIFFDKVWDFVVDFFPGTICLVFATVWNWTCHFAWYLLRFGTFTFHFAWYLLYLWHFNLPVAVFIICWWFKCSCGVFLGIFRVSFTDFCVFSGFHVWFPSGFHLRCYFGFL